MLEPVAIGWQIRPHGGGGDHLIVEFLQVQLCGSADTFESATDDVLAEPEPLRIYRPTIPSLLSSPRW